MEGKNWVLEAKKRRLVDTSSTFHKARCVLFVHRRRNGNVASL